MIRSLFKLGIYFGDLLLSLDSLDTTSEVSQLDLNKMKILKLILCIFNNFLKGKYINFSLYEIFGENSFIDYLKINLDLGSSCFKYLVVKNSFFVMKKDFPKYFEIIVENNNLLSESYLELIFLHFDQKYQDDLLKVSFKILELVFQKKFGSIESQFLQEEVIFPKSKNIFKNLCSFVFEEYMIGSSDLRERLKNFASNNFEV